MVLCSITPKDNCAWMFREPMVMLLTHLVEKYEDYRAEALKHKDTYKILDNSLIELGGALSMERLIAAADAVQADEIILPDVFRDGEATIHSTERSIEWLKNHGYLGKYKLMAVCHGTTEEAFKKCYYALNNNKYIDAIGIPKVMSSMDWVQNRSRASLYPIFKDSEKEIHFLGSWYSLNEIIELPKEVFDKVRSCDTCLPALCVIQNKTIYEDREGTIDLERSYPQLVENKYNALMASLEKAIVQKQLGIGD